MARGPNKKTIPPIFQFQALLPVSQMKLADGRETVDFNNSLDCVTETDLM